MTPGARAQAAIDVIDQLLSSWLSEKRFPADKLLDNFFKSHRYIGSKDRAFVGELFYWIVRHKASLEWWIERTGQRLHGRSFVFAALVFRKEYSDSLSKDSQYSAPPPNEDEQSMIDKLHTHEMAHPDMPDHVRLNYPEWCDPHLRAAFGDQFETALNALNEQAPTDLRVNTLKTSRELLHQALHDEGFENSLSTLSPVGLRLARRMPVFTSPHFKKGHFEVQDEGSQMVAELVDAKAGMRVIDFCAGAGGKTLALAAAMENKGRILAWDTSEKRLNQITLRLRRAGVGNVQTHVLTSENDTFIKRHKQSADRVLVDAPCSGSGTWRRNPDIKWRFTPKDLEEVTAVQQSILQSAARLVKPGGRLVYATCSVLREENEHQVDQFLKSVNNFDKNVSKFKVVCAKKIWDKNNSTGDSDTVSYLSVSPHQDGVDGFFCCRVRTHCNISHKKRI
jgi:16S rRNA (cytosine967-C5)-methyltransferase